jgi:hypothetical protein
MSRARLVDRSWSLINQRGSRDLDAGGHGGCWRGIARPAEGDWA